MRARRKQNWNDDTAEGKKVENCKEKLKKKSELFLAKKI
jgi:hypothetical protein